MEERKKRVVKKSKYHEPIKIEGGFEQAVKTLSQTTPKKSKPKK